MHKLSLAIYIIFPTQMLDMPTCAQIVPIRAIVALHLLRLSPNKLRINSNTRSQIRYRSLEVIPTYKATVSSHDLCLCV